MVAQQETIREVLSTAGKLEETILLIYANDAVLDTTGLTTDLPDALKVCVKKRSRSREDRSLIEYVGLHQH